MIRIAIVTIFSLLVTACMQGTPVIALRDDVTLFRAKPQPERLTGQQSAIVMGFKLDTKFNMKRTNVVFQNLSAKEDERHFVYFEPKFCQTRNCDNMTTEYIVIKVDPGDYALSQIITEWLFLPDTTFSYFFDHKNLNAIPQKMKFAVNPGEIVYIGDMTIKPYLDSYRHFFPKTILDISPKISNKISNIEFNAEIARSHASNYTGKNTNFIEKKPSDSGNLPLQATVNRFAFEDVFFHKNTN